MLLNKKKNIYQKERYHKFIKYKNNFLLMKYRVQQKNLSHYKLSPFLVPVNLGKVIMVVPSSLCLITPPQESVMIMAWISVNHVFVAELFLKTGIKDYKRTLHGPCAFSFVFVLVYWQQ